MDKDGARHEDASSHAAPTSQPASRNQAALDDFARYCQAHPELRFWQALRAWSGAAYVLSVDAQGKMLDTYYREGRDW